MSKTIHSDPQLYQHQMDATNIDSTTAELFGTVNAYGLSTTVTFEYGTTTSYGSTVTAYQSPVTGDSITHVSADISGLTPCTIYHFRVKAENSLGTVYGSDAEFKCGYPPTATTLYATNYTCTSATLNGTVNANAASSVVTFQYGTTTAYGKEVTSGQSPVSSIRNVSADISGLSADSTYHFRVKAENSCWTSYGSDKTISRGLITLTTASVKDITATTAISGGNITSDGCKPITDRGVSSSRGGRPPHVYQIHSGTGTGSFTCNLTGLKPSTTYYVRAYATNDDTIIYGDRISFKTAP